MSVGITGGNILRRRHRRKCEDINIMDKDLVGENVDWIKLTQGRFQWWDLGNIIKNHLYFRKEEYFDQLNTYEYKMSLKRVVRSGMYCLRLQSLWLNQTCK
jgi:hypothetical protein